VADAGTHLGEDPSDPTRRATRRASLLYQLATEPGLALTEAAGENLYSAVRLPKRPRARFWGDAFIASSGCRAGHNLERR
jgi:hypothetical protein